MKRRAACSLAVPACPRRHRLGRRVAHRRRCRVDGLVPAASRLGGRDPRDGLPHDGAGRALDDEVHSGPLDRLRRLGGGGGPVAPADRGGYVRMLAELAAAIRTRIPRRPPQGPHPAALTPSAQAPWSDEQDVAPSGFGHRSGRCGREPVEAASTLDGPTGDSSDGRSSAHALHSATGITAPATHRGAPSTSWAKRATKAGRPANPKIIVPSSHCANAVKDETSERHQHQPRAALVRHSQADRENAQEEAAQRVHRRDTTEPVPRPDHALAHADHRKTHRFGEPPHGRSSYPTTKPPSMPRRRTRITARGRTSPDLRALERALDAPVPFPRLRSQIWSRPWLARDRTDP
jgi:hypothetical protein